MTPASKQSFQPPLTHVVSTTQPLAPEDLKMGNESGDMKLPGNFSKVPELVSINPDYNPAKVATPDFEHSKNGGTGDSHDARSLINLQRGLHARLLHCRRDSIRKSN